MASPPILFSKTARPECLTMQSDGRREIQFGGKSMKTIQNFFLGLMLGIIVTPGNWL